MKITIDGPAASGKSTLGAALAQRLGYLFFDTGIMYRAITLAGLQRKIDLHDVPAVSALAEQVKIDVIPPSVADGRQFTVLLDTVDVTWLLRERDVDANVSLISSYPSVRREMVRQQRRIAQQGNVVMVGRDIGTVVLPDADLKIYLDATVEERARRRHSELVERGQPDQYAQVLAAMRERDLFDSSRETSPLRPAADAIRIDSTHRPVADIVAELESIIARWQLVVSAGTPQDNH